MSVTIEVKCVTKSSRNPFRVNVYRYSQNGTYTLTVHKLNDRETCRAMVDTLYRSNKRAERIHIKYTI